MTTYLDLVFNVVSSSAPAWFTAINDGQWGTTAVAGTLDAVSPVVSGKRNSAITRAWTGGCVDQTRGEYILAANGGHGDYSGNEVYALALKTATPAWARITEPTPDGQILATELNGAAVAVNADGKPRAVHGWHRCCFGDGKVWYVGQDAYVSGNGSFTPYTVSFDRASLAWRTDYGLWTGKTQNGVGATGPAVYDRNRNRVWTFAAQGFNPTSVWSINCSTGAYTGPHASINGAYVYESWAAYAHDLDVIVFGLSNQANMPGYIGVFRPATLQFSLYLTTNSWSATGSDGQAIANMDKRMGAVYDPVNKCVYLFDAGWSLGAAIKVLQIPASLGGSGASFAWRTHTPTGGETPAAPASYRGTYSKFNLIEDMGGGKRALVCVTDTLGPTYVMPLPAGGL